MGVLIALLAAAIGVALAWVVIGIEPIAPRLPALVDAAMDASGVQHPVTAVLLAFRAYDTMLEVAVLLVAVLPVLAAPAGDPASARPQDVPREPVLSPFTRLLVPLAIVVSAYLLWVGSYAPGGAFQAGAVLAAAAVLLRLAGRLPAIGVDLPWVRVALVGGFAVFLGVALATAAAGAGMLALPPTYAKAIIVTIEIALTLSIAALLCSMFPGAVVPDPGVASLDEGMSR
jgi:multisubunit Na+/H+ antiporter MnhB subunit